MLRRILVLVLAALAAPAYGQGIDSLKNYYRSVQSLSGDFVQTTRNELDEIIESSSGQLWIQRPDRFRWAYREPFEQDIVADGKQLWVYDKDLEQVTVRPLTEVLGLGPALLLSGDYKSLEESFTIREQDGWVELIPKQSDWDFQSVRLRLDQGVPSVVEVDSGLGQITRLELRNLTRNPQIATSRFKFVPPEGVDIVSPGPPSKGG